SANALNTASISCNNMQPNGCMSSGDLFELLKPYNQFFSNGKSYRVGALRGVRLQAGIAFSPILLNCRVLRRSVAKRRRSPRGVALKTHSWASLDQWPR